MTDERYAYVQTQKERKQMANGARGRKGSRGPKSCKLPSDYLTRKEKKALNSDVMNWDMKRFYAWKEFRKMPKDIQIEYLNRLTTIYNAPFTAICKYVLLCSDSAFWSHINRFEMKQYLNPTSKNKAGKERLIEDVMKSRNITPSPGFGLPLSTLEQKNDPTPELKTLSTVLTHASFEMNGFDRDFIDILEQRFGSQNVRVSITVEVIDE